MFRSDDRKKEKESMRESIKGLDFAKVYKTLYTKRIKND
jgi:hypothetical protein